jgi:hypothetical protein
MSEKPVKKSNVKNVWEKVIKRRDSREIISKSWNYEKKELDFQAAKLYYECMDNGPIKLGSARDQQKEITKKERRKNSN